MGVSFIEIGKTGGGINWEEIKNLLRVSNGHIEQVAEDTDQ